MLNLNTIFDGTAFALDNRSIEETLQNFKDYVSLIPFEDDGKCWDEIFFPHEDDISLLAARYRTPALADGNLPPQQAFLLAFLRLLETPKALFNSLPARHRLLYYRDLLGLAPRGAQADQVAVSFELSAGTADILLPAGTALDGGQDSQGQPLHYLLDAALQANSGRLSDVRWARPPRTGEAGVQCYTVQADEVAFPSEGVRLFAPQAQETVAASGLVVAAQVLALSSGTRTLTVTFAAAQSAIGLSAAVSTEQGWLALPAGVQGDAETKVVFTVAADQPAFVPPQGLAGFNDTVPLLKLSRTDGLDVPLVELIEVNTDQPSNIAFATQDGPAQIDQPCLPFGAEPLLGACVRLMAPDWCRKADPITVTLTPDWHGLPESVDFATWYRLYAPKPMNDNYFTVIPEALMANVWTSLPVDPPVRERPLFYANAVDTTAPSGAALEFSFTNLPSDVSDSADPADWGSQLRLVLIPNTFLHQQYWQAVSEGTTDLNPPYTPQWNCLSVSYSSSQDIDANAQYRLTPFGHQPPGTLAPALTQPQLYLGFSDLHAGQQLSLYWKLQSPQPLSVDWHYLDQQNQWTSLNADVLDSTGGLFTSGLWLATLPGDASDQAAQMPTGRHWLRGVMTPSVASDDETMSDYPQLQGLLANAMTATLADVASVAHDHFDQPLPARRVAQTVEPLPGLAGVSQPWPSEHGRGPESPSSFNSRAANRLAHRERALRRNDARSLLLEQFPEVGAVILPEGVSTPGELQLTVIPAPGQRDNEDAERPVFNPARLDGMADYLQARCSPWAKLRVNSPVYTDVPVVYVVTFVDNISPDFGHRQLLEDLNRHYLPWAYDTQTALSIGTQLDYYALVAFIEQRPYIAQVSEVWIKDAQQSVQAHPNEILIPVLNNAVVSTVDLGETTLASCYGLACNSLGDLFIADRVNNKVFKRASNGDVSVYIGNIGSGATITYDTFATPHGLYVDATDTLYVTTAAHRAIFKVANGTLITFITPTITAENSIPRFVAVNDAGDACYTNDPSNEIVYRNAGGTETILAYVQFSEGILLKDNLIYFSSKGFELIQVLNYLLNPPFIENIGGNSSGHRDGAFEQARFSDPYQLAFDSTQSSIFVADSNNHCIRRISLSARTVTTLAGSPTVLGNDDGSANCAKFTQPLGVAMAPDGSIYVADNGNKLIRKITTYYPN